MKQFVAVVSFSVLMTALPMTEVGRQRIVYDFCYADLDAWDIACEIGIADPDGSNATVLTAGAYGADSAQPAPSPDGSSIAFVRGIFFDQQSPGLE
ncbi:MAG: hypothetical protein H0W08_26970, partial [Acidobacteria bacterium]|nr:hypothetical protein [Acidobacteriota bacterium]